MTTKTQDCEHCNKSSLSLLLLRPSPVSKLVALGKVCKTRVIQQRSQRFEAMIS
jgi:hypothetical protein